MKGASIQLVTSAHVSQGFHHSRHSLFPWRGQCRQGAGRGLSRMRMPNRHHRADHAGLGGLITITRVGAEPPRRMAVRHKTMSDPLLAVGIYQ